MALLGKQYWRLLVNDTSLVSKVFKAKYYANETLLLAELGDNLSFVWRSILKAKGLIQAEVTRTIGTGEHTSILCDPWLPYNTNGYVISSHPALVNQNDLWSLKVPPKVNNFLWRTASSSLPTCAQLEKRHVPVNPICPLCLTTAETIFYALFGCVHARACWNRTSVVVGGNMDEDFSNWLLELQYRGKEGELEEAAMVRAIWRARNDFVCQQKSWTAANVVTSARMLLDQFKYTQKRKGLSLSSLFDGGHLVEHWSAPSSG
ncbi:uncharacterized protein LOC133036855 [Cannabis sativa]|uniref:uncharacterized protein LOC133036855 n=1 Tax=Cannabis sativa TaxID=3483 RepID=UPI0029C9FFAC|nr:uncharacterized protein LOC133036855 [Cannabis sativa]